MSNAIMKTAGTWKLNISAYITTKKQALSNWYYLSFKKGNAYQYIWKPFKDDSDDEIVRVHGFGLGRLGGRHSTIKVVNRANGMSFTAKAAGVTDNYGIKSKKVVVLGYNQRRYLGLKANEKTADIVIHGILSKEQSRLKELFYVKLGIFVAVVSLLITVS